VPLDINGKTVVVDGVASLKEISVEELKDQAQDAKKSKEVVDAIKEPKTEIVVEANGILVM
jgi:hypothetical protein